MKLGRIGSHRANGCSQELWCELIGIDLDQTAHIAAFELEKWLNGRQIPTRSQEEYCAIRGSTRARKDRLKAHTFAIPENNGEHFEKSIGKLAHPGPPGSLRGT
jgi:hypothetical protein